MKCSICGLSGEKTRLFDVISSEGIIKVCEACSKAEDMPIIRRPTTFQLKESEKKPRIYNMLLSAREKKDEFSEQLKKEHEKTKIETTLKEITDKNYEVKISQEEKPRPDLIENFHWVIMRARRMKKLTPEQLAKEISESTAAIKMAERGILPEDDYRLVNKLESFLGIRIIKDASKIKSSGILEKQPVRILRFDPKTMKDLTISDLKDLKEKRTDFNIWDDNELMKEENIEEEKE